MGKMVAKSKSQTSQWNNKGAKLDNQTSQLKNLNAQLDSQKPWLTRMNTRLDNQEPHLILKTLLANDSDFTRRSKTWPASRFRSMNSPSGCIRWIIL